MTYRYRNANTGDEVEYPYRNARLEMLPNWTRVPTEEPEPVHEPAPAVPETVSPHPEPEAEQSGAQATIGRPPVSEPKARWVEYALGLAQDSDEAAEIATLTKAQLIDRYGSKEN